MLLQHSAGTGPSLLRALAVLPRRACVAFRAGLRIVVERMSQRRALAQLNDELLRDIGLTREEAAAEAEKPFWVA